MSLLKVIPNIFYEDIQIGLDLFIDGLRFKPVYVSSEGDPFYILERDGVRLHIIQSAPFAQEHRPEIRIETDNIEQLYKEISALRPDLLHPNLNKVTLRPWGLKEFALLDKTTVCVIIQQKS
ncbi:hypothetical protein AHMF7605_18360 [Adhaeribacter arboris]|uniref:Uncharacterized protein n=1 Tax=Adhaeribacter arboris TaxID=2072846 RepID=A0A2T2YIL2_9BACT|nr:hypothetical protein [Adhaeribacter arboris]PSR55329.1 hypothetical protein AHMF7605_18360 [Adhaeribacter arboris]